MFLARVLWRLGYPDEALRCAERAVAIAKEISHPVQLGRSSQLGSCAASIAR
jgi:hypothetical protein